MILTDTQDRRIGILLLLAAIAIFAWVAFHLWERAISLTRDNSSMTGAEGIVAIPSPVQNPYDVGEIVNSHLFGQKLAATPKPKKEAPKEVAKTRLRLKLLGLVSSDDDDGGMARALISAENGRVNSYGIGQQIDKTNSSVHTIEEFRVLLEREGQLESLEMARPKLLKKKEQPPGRSSSARNQPPQQRNVRQSPPNAPLNENSVVPVVNQFNEDQPVDAQFDEQFNEQFDEEFNDEQFNDSDFIVDDSFNNQEQNFDERQNARVLRQLPVPIDVDLGPEPNFDVPENEAIYTGSNAPDAFPDEGSNQGEPAN